MWVKKLIENRNEMINKEINRVIYCYGEWQSEFDKMENVEFIKGVDSVFKDNDFFRSGESTLLILDDLANELSGNPKASKLFTQGIHHRNVSIVFITQNLYKQGKAMRDIQLNCQYLVLFKNCRDVNQIKVLSNQMGLAHLPETYRKVTSQPYQPLVVDMRPGTADYLRVRLPVLPGEYMRVYIGESNSLLCPKTPGN